MKRVLILILSIAICLSMYSCSNSDSSENTLNSELSDNTSESKNDDKDLLESRLGDSIETDILRITLINAQFAIKLNSSSHGTLEQIQSGNTELSDEYFTPEEYDPQNDTGKSYIASKGHTYVSIEFKAENLDRSTIEFDGPFNDKFITVNYNKKNYNEKTNYGCKSQNGFKWIRHTSENVMLISGQESYYRCYIDIPVDVSNLNDDFSLIFYLPNSKGKATKFKYIVTDADRKALESQEMSIDEAIYNFTSEEGQSYFKKHMEEYPSLSGADIQKIVKGKKLNIIIKEVYGSWKGAFRFDSDGRIQETIPNIGVGYYNNRTWSIRGDMLILDNEDACQVRKINDDSYLLVRNNAPFAVLFNSLSK